MRKKVLTFILLPILLCSICCSVESGANSEEVEMNSLANAYVRLGLFIGNYDKDFVDAYYGPDSLRVTVDSLHVFPKDSILQSIEKLRQKFLIISKATERDSIRCRANWISHQLTAFERRVKIFTGETDMFDTESSDLFDAVAPTFNEAHFQKVIGSLDHILPGKGDLLTRFDLLSKKFLIPENKIDTVFKVAIAEARARTKNHYTLPEGESFQLEYVRDKPWSGYNWYQGNYQSKIQINVSQPIFIERAIDLACHEGYPGHHVFNALLEKNLYRNKGWTEISLYPLFSPQSLIAEGSANYGISLAFPGHEQERYCKEVLMPLAGIDTTDAHSYFRALELKATLNYARNEIARAFLSNKMSEEVALVWMRKYCLLTDETAHVYLNFIKKYRSYVINYNYGQELIRNYIELKVPNDADQAKRWRVFRQLLSNEVRAGDLIVKRP